MNDQDYIRKAVELADGWSLCGGWGETALQGRSNKRALDALAAQLVRQVDAMENVHARLRRGHSLVVAYEDDFWVNKSITESPDRTMNTIKAIVDSKVLNKEQSNE